MHARILALDSATSGLDASTAFHVCAWICAYSRHTGAAAVLVLQQPTVETFELFEDVILLAEVRQDHHDDDASQPPPYPAPVERTALSPHTFCQCFSCSTRMRCRVASCTTGP